MLEKAAKIYKKNASLILLLLVLFLSIPPRMWKLTEYPSIVVDEAANLRDINRLLTLKTFRPIDFEWGFAQATLVHYPAILLIKLGMQDEFFALRLTSVILSVLALIPFFLILRKYTNLLTSFLTTILFSYSYFFLQFSRVGWTNIHMLTVSIYILFFVEKAAETKKSVWFILGGIFSGVLLYMYRAGEIIIAASAVYILTKSVQQKISFKKVCINITLFAGPTVVVGLPWVIKILFSWEQYTLRERVVSIFNAPKPYHGLVDITSILFYQLDTVLMSWVFMLPHQAGGIESQRYLPLSYTTISPILILLFFLGIFLAIKSFKNTFNWFIIFVLGLLFGQVLSVDPPNGSRGLILLPIIYFFIGISIFSLYE